LEYQLIVLNCIGKEAENAAAGLQPDQVLLLENLRFHSEEEAGDVAFAKQLAALGDIM
jgi:phosphoglycerate kinase